MKYRLIFIILALCLSSISLTAQDLRTYLPSYRLKQFFTPDLSGRTPWYSMQPFTKKDSTFFSDSLPADYSYSTGEMILRKFDQIYYFSAVMNEDDETLLTQENHDQLRFLQRVRQLRGTDIILCISGDSGGFIPLLRDPDSRSRILEELNNALNVYELAGIDLDWEFPRNDQEKSVYLDFLKDLRTLCSSGNRQLSIAVSRFRALPEESYSTADFINLMTYDFYGRHSTLESTKEALDFMMARYSIPPEKLLMGIPYYGRIFDGYSPDYWKKSQSYKELIKLGISTPETNEIDGYFFNGADMVQRKVETGRTLGISGYFIWEIGQDSFGNQSLTRTLISSLQSGDHSN